MISDLYDLKNQIHAVLNLAELQTLQTIYSHYPGIPFEERVKIDLEIVRRQQSFGYTPISINIFVSNGNDLSLNLVLGASTAFKYDSDGDVCIQDSPIADSLFTVNANGDIEVI